MSRRDPSVNPGGLPLTEAPTPTVNRVKACDSMVVEFPREDGTFTPRDTEDSSAPARLPRKQELEGGPVDEYERGYLEYKRAMA